jgi:hypothetical protein
MVRVMVVNYRHITPAIMYGCVSHRNVLRIGEHAHLETAFCERDMQEANKGLHSFDYNFGYLHPSPQLHFEEWLSALRAVVSMVGAREPLQHCLEYISLPHLR